MWPFNLLTEDAQVVILAAACGLIGALIGYAFKAWLDRREYERRRQQEQERDRLNRKLVRSASLGEIEKFAQMPMMDPEIRRRRIYIPAYIISLILCVLVTGLLILLFQLTN
jgi:membrane protein YqaA with SNARE-associated domain